MGPGVGGWGLGLWLSGVRCFGFGVFGRGGLGVFSFTLFTVPWLLLGRVQSMLANFRACRTVLLSLLLFSSQG